MLKKDSMLITTTSTIEGWEVKKYLGTITTNVVTGTGLFSDIFASFSDVFGGRSQSYQNQITSIYNEAIGNLKQKAKELGGNAVIGLKIDNDEISGKGKTMFMITAIGTVVIANSSNNEEYPKDSIPNFIEADELNLLLEKNKIIHKAKYSDEYLSDDDYVFLNANQVSEVLPYLINDIENIHSNGEQHSNYDFLNNAKDFIVNLPNESVFPYLLDIINSDIDYSFVENIVKKKNLVDYDEYNKLLNTENIKTQKRVLSLLRFDKSRFTKSDISRISKIEEKINLVFKKKSKIVQSRGKLSSKSIEKWLCACGVENKIDQGYCSKCFNDQYGFKDNEYKPQRIIEILNEKKSVLIEIFNEE